MNLDVNWHNAELQCEGGPRPDGSGLRVAFAGPAHADGRRLRLVFGVDAVHEGRAGHALPTNLTVIFEGEDRLFATRGDDHCTVMSVGSTGPGCSTGRCATGASLRAASAAPRPARSAATRASWSAVSTLPARRYSKTTRQHRHHRRPRPTRPSLSIP